MRRVNIWRLTLFKTSLWLFLWVLAAPTFAQLSPNFVVLFADDLGYGDLGSYGHPNIRTPNIDALAHSGQRWTDFYVASPVCSPSRGALLTGRLPPRTGLYGEHLGVYFPGDPGGFPAHETTIAERLKTAGYRTAIVGKWHLGDTPDARPTRHGFDEWFGVPYSNDMDWVDEPTFDEVIGMSRRGENDKLQALFALHAQKYAAPINGYWNVPLVSSKVTANTWQDYVVERPAQQSVLTQRYTQAAVDFIEQQAGQPFFLYVPYAMPHTPLFRSPGFAGKSLGGRYGDVIEELDWSVGEIVSALDKAGVAENTLVIFTSDNGPWLTMRTEGGSAGLLRAGKGTTFEGGMRVPAVFSWPGRLKAGVVSGMGATLDIYRTFAALAGVNGEAGVDGVDLSPVLFGRGQSPRSMMPYYRRGQLYALRQGPWKLHFITEGAYGQPPTKTKHERPQLYHLRNDPSERFDVAESHPDVVARLTKMAKDLEAGLTKQPAEFDRRLFVLTSED